MPRAKATLSLVPTPSALETRTGLEYFVISRRKSPPNPPISPNTCLLKVFCARYLMRCLVRSPAERSTPAEEYVAGGWGDLRVASGKAFPIPENCQFNIGCGHRKICGFPYAE